MQNGMFQIIFCFLIALKIIFPSIVSAVEDVSGTRLAVTAVAKNSSLPVIEAVERQDQSFCLGVQYHPEISVRKVKENADDANLYMDADLAMTGFNALVETICGDDVHKIVK